MALLDDKARYYVYVLNGGTLSYQQWLNSGKPTIPSEDASGGGPPELDDEETLTTGDTTEEYPELYEGWEEYRKEEFFKWVKDTYGWLSWQYIGREGHWANRENDDVYAKYIEETDAPKYTEDTGGEDTGGVENIDPITGEPVVEGSGEYEIPLPQDAEYYGYYKGLGNVRWDETSGTYWYFDTNMGIWLTIGYDALSQFDQGVDATFDHSEVIEEGGYTWIVDYDTDGNRINQKLYEDSRELTAYEQAQLDLAHQQLAADMASRTQMTPYEQAQYEAMMTQQAAQYSEPRDWIQRWTYDWYADNEDYQTLLSAQTQLSNDLAFVDLQLSVYETFYGDDPEGADIIKELKKKKDKLQLEMESVTAKLDSTVAPDAPAPEFLDEYTGIRSGQPIYATDTKTASGQSLSNLAPTELEGVYGYVDWAAGRSPDATHASGEDWMYKSQKLLPQQAAQRAYSWEVK